MHGWMNGWMCCRKGDPSRAWEWALANTQKWIVRGDTHTDKARDFIGKGHPGGEQQGKGTQENCSATCLAVSGFMVMRLVSGLSLVNHLAWPVFGLTRGPSWWHVHLSAKMDSSEKDSGRLVGHMDWHLLPPSGLSRILLVSFRWQHHVPYQDLLLWDNLRKWLSSCLA